MIIGTYSIIINVDIKFAFSYDGVAQCVLFSNARETSNAVQTGMTH